VNPTVQIEYVTYGPQHATQQTMQQTKAKGSLNPARHSMSQMRQS
jgi:hypothetical protein